MKIKNVIKALHDQGPLTRAFRNFVITRNAWGLFSKNSHFLRSNGNPKITYNRRFTAEFAAKAMAAKYDRRFSAYKCIYCDGFHIGGND